jgi:hypothetical protein
LVLWLFKASVFSSFSQKHKQNFIINSKMSLPEQECEYDCEHFVNMCIAYFERLDQSCPTLDALETTLTNLLESGTDEDRQIAMIIQDDLYAMIPHNSPSSNLSSAEEESDDDDVLNTAFTSSPNGIPRLPPFIGTLSPVFETPIRPPPPFDLIEFPLTQSTNLDETIDWDEDVIDQEMCHIAARYDTFCKCCNAPVKIDIFR